MPQVNLDLSEDLIARVQLTAKTAGLSIEDLLTKQIEETFNVQQPDFFKTAHPDDLSSEKNIDYTVLQHYLRVQDWEEADYETYLAIIKCCGLTEGQYLSSLVSKTMGYTEVAESIPATDLRTINQLWLKYSQGKFGFSTQKRIHIKMGGTIPCVQDVAGFYKALGWELQDSENKSLGTVRHHQYQFTLDAPRGHLPSHRFWRSNLHNWHNFFSPFLVRLLKFGM